MTTYALVYHRSSDNLKRFIRFLLDMYPMIQLKKGKEATVGVRHPWIFSGAIDNKDEKIVHGSMVGVVSATGSLLGVGSYSSHGSIAVRMMAWDDAVIDSAWIEKKIRAANERRKLLGYGPGTDTTGYRVVFGESDGLPGLVVDRYDDVLVLQISITTMENMRTEIVDALTHIFSPRAIVERSDIGVRRDEGLDAKEGVIYGETEDAVAYVEHGRASIAYVLQGQKTGAFLDQKDLRDLIERYAEGKTVANVFSYTGASAVAALKGGAESVVNVDSSAFALAGCEAMLKANKLSSKKVENVESDVFQWFGDRRTPEYDMVILDPPALIKSQKDQEEGMKAYHFLNRAALRLVKTGGIFVTSSCSHFLTEDDFQFVLRRASVQAGVIVRVLAVVGQSTDHPQSVYFPESRYLTSYVLQVESRI